MYRKSVVFLDTLSQESIVIISVINAAAALAIAVHIATRDTFKDIFVISRLSSRSS